MQPNWKFWQNQAERAQRADRLMRYQTERDVAVAELAQSRAKATRLLVENQGLRDMLRLQQASPNAREVAAQLGEQLVVVTEATPWWRHLHGLLQLEIDQAVDDALMPDLTNDTANLRRGRAAMLKDFRGLLQDIYLQPQTRKRGEG